MKEADIERILERAKEKYPEARPRIISDNGPQFVAGTSRSLFTSRG
jgi:putative transposase